MRRIWLIGLAVLLVCPSLGGLGYAAEKITINTGEENGAYHGDFCPVFQKQLAAKGYEAACTPSSGTADNMRRVGDDPLQFGYGQLDVVALEAERFGGASKFARVRSDDVRECLFAVTKAKSLSSYGALAVAAKDMTIILPPQASGSAATFRYLQQIDPDGLGLARDVQFAADTEEAIRLTLANDQTVTLFVQFPDPANARFKLISQLGGHIVPVIDRTILAQRLDDAPVYFAQETQVTNSNWLKADRSVVTACTPQVIFTGATVNTTDDAAWSRHATVSTTISKLSADALLPDLTFFARVMRRTKELSTIGAEKFVKLSDEARQRAKPLLEKAKSAAEKAVEAAKPQGTSGRGDQQP